MRNDRSIAKVAHSRLFADVREVADLAPSFGEEPVRFFKAYNTLKGQLFEVLAIGDAARDAELVAE